jgi:hypothetical protein
METNQKIQNDKNVKGVKRPTNAYERLSEFISPWKITQENGGINVIFKVSIPDLTEITATAPSLQYTAI